ncbi:MAG: hypothetical protein IPJ85_16320 [Flavobacteriales bacterium]|nr:hypothetical protein [Flavobacteriales bacterium]
MQLLGTSVLLEQDQLVGGGASTSRTGVLALHDALLHLNSQRLTFTNPAPSAITRDAGMLISETDALAGYGRVDWRIGASAPANYVVPFGNAVTGHYLPLTMAIATSGAGANGALSFATTPPIRWPRRTTRPLPTGLPSLVDMVGFENASNVWDAATGSSSRAVTARHLPQRSPSPIATANGTAAPIPSARHCCRHSASTEPRGRSRRTVMANTALNTVTTALTIEYASIWALVQSFTPLPVELLDFDAKAEGRKVRCMGSRHRN